MNIELMIELIVRTLTYTNMTTNIITSYLCMCKITCNLLVCNLFSLYTTILDMDGIGWISQLHASTEANLGQLGKQHVFCVQITFVAT